MSEPTDVGGAPPPVPPSSLGEREEFFTATLQRAQRMVNTAEAVRLQLMLAGLEAMVLEEEAVTGRPLRVDDPVVTGFHLHQANELRTTRNDIQHRLEAALMLRDHLPLTWAVFLDGQAAERSVIVAAQQAVGLAPQHFPAYDVAAAALVGEERPGQVQRVLADLRDRLDPEAAAARHRTASNRRYVRARPEGDGQGVLEIHSTAADIAAAYDRIRKHAVAAHGREGECRTLGALMVDEALDAILTGTMRGPAEGGPSYPGERLGETVDPTRTVIDATILVTVPAGAATGATDELGQVAGTGAIDADTLRVIVAHTATWTRAVIDPVDDAVLGIDSHERYIPAGLKKLLHLRQPTCGCGCGLPAHRADIDHVQRFEHDGRTRHDNLQVACRMSHQAKDAGFADVRMLPDGSVRWRDKWGGTRIIKPALTVKTPVWPEDAPF